MKSILIIGIFIFSFLPAQANSFYFAWHGAGVASRFNYNMGYSYGAYYYRGVTDGLALGTLEFYQKFVMNYGNETRSTVGSSLSTNVTYRFFSPMIVFQMNKKGQTQMYTTAGVGELQSGGTAVFSKWSHAAWSPQGGEYDSSIDISTSLNKYVFRLGFGLTQFLPLFGNFHLFINEDAGFLVRPMADISGGQYAAVKTNVAQFFQPTYISIRVGIGFITHSKDNPSPWRLYAGEPDNFYSN